MDYINISHIWLVYVFLCKNYEKEFGSIGNQRTIDKMNCK